MADHSGDDSNDNWIAPETAIIAAKIQNTTSKLKWGNGVVQFLEQDSDKRNNQI